MILSVVIPNYNTKDLLKTCLLSIKKYLPPNTEIIVVDNASKDDSVALLKKEFPEVIIIENAINGGFARSANQGIRLAQNEIVMLVNSDIEFFDQSYLASLAFLEKSQQNIGVIGPKLLNSDGSLQPSAFKNFPGMLTIFWENTLLGQLANKLFPYNQLPGKYLFSNKEHEKKLACSHVGGALWVLKKKCWQDLSGFDERFFMFREETDFCLRAKKAGWQIIYLPEFSVYHHQRQSIRIVGYDKKLKKYFKSVYLYERKYHSLPLVGLLYLLNLLKSFIALVIEIPLYLIFKILFLNKIAVKIKNYLIYNYLALKIHLGL